MAQGFQAVHVGLVMILAWFDRMSLLKIYLAYLIRPRLLVAYRLSSLRQKIGIGEAAMKQLLVLFDSETNDTVFDDAGEVLTPGGRKFAVLLSEELTKTGLTTSDVFQRSFYGWEFEISTESSRFLAVVQQAETWLVAIGDISGVFKRLMSRASEAELERVANAVRDAVVSTGIGTDVRIEHP